MQEDFLFTILIFDGSTQNHTNMAGQQIHKRNENFLKKK
jgi:hypothetical protein